MQIQKIRLDYSYVFPFIHEDEIKAYQKISLNAMNSLFTKSGSGNDLLGWLNLPNETYHSNVFSEIQNLCQEIAKEADLFICIGIGGSYLGAKAILEALLHPFHNMQDKKIRNLPKFLFAGHNISGSYLQAVLSEVQKEKSVYVNVISKSGTTTEPGIAFRAIKIAMEEKYGSKEAAKRIIATTDAKKGALKLLADNKGYRIFIIPDDVGGRFSVLTPVGLIPIGALGLNIKNLLEGARYASEYGKEQDINKNPALLYAIIRNLLFKKNYHTEIIVNYEPCLHYFAEWWKQLYGESEGKNGKGIYPSSVDFTTDLHSMGQWIQEGERIIFETILHIEKDLSNLTVPNTANNLDELEYLSGKSYSEINRNAMKATLVAHYDGKVPNLIFNIPELNEFNLGQLIYLFEEACGISGYLMEVNPFNQPGVEAYKKNMFALLNKKGFESIKYELENKEKKLPRDKSTH